MDKKEEVKGSAPFLEHASKGMLTFCGSLVALSIALTVIGFDAKPLIDAYSQQIIAGLEQSSECAPALTSYDDILDRVIALESISHKPINKK